MTNEIVTYNDNKGFVFEIEYLKEENAKMFTITIPKEVYEKEEIGIEWGNFVGEGYEKMIDYIIGVYIKEGMLIVKGFMKK
ncbi:hypothetical protein P4I85_34430 [Bacillus cereus]|nr:hypothetical protein [Bacillus cereus]MRC07952.1 hypothetical protein [Bacillus thuringiensis]MEB9514559.1 hypothetical protein [Bacillus cereus]MEB9565487.1 hypothetical protein [Bacillus cereus]MEC2468643.1 hypothetical protein [Bacillus cereus]